MFLPSSIVSVVVVEKVSMVMVGGGSPLLLIFITYFTRQIKSSSTTTLHRHSHNAWKRTSALLILDFIHPCKMQDSVSQGQDGQMAFIQDIHA